MTAAVLLTTAAFLAVLIGTASGAQSKSAASSATARLFAFDPCPALLL